VRKILEQQGDQQRGLHDANAAGGQTTEDMPRRGRQASNIARIVPAEVAEPPFVESTADR
jgi:hypothetical protein